VKDFEKIDWKKYNKPPFYQQWMCCGDTLKLATFGDRGLEEIDNRILSIIHQWDMDNAAGHFLDRMGKILNVPRKGNTDDNYRILLKLQKSINTNNSSIPDIIRVLKFFYSNEVIEIKPNYPAGISILHNGEGPPIDFNRIMIQVVGAGIAFDTKELFDFTDEIDISDSSETLISRNVHDTISQIILRNGRILRDGNTVFDTELENLHRNGTVKRNGTVTRNSVRIIPASGEIIQPVYRRSGMQDIFSIGFNDGNYIDALSSYLFRNGAIVRNGAARRTGYSPYSMNDTLSAATIELFMKDYATITDQWGTAVVVDYDESIDRHIVRNGSHKRNEKIYRSSFGIVDPFDVDYSETQAIDNFDVNEVMDTGVRYHWFRNNKLNRSGSYERKGMIFIPLE
jgi:hypothetical protein